MADREGGKGSRYDRAVGVLLQTMTQSGHFQEAFEVASAFALEEERSQGFFLSNKALQAMLTSLKNLGHRNLLLKTWEALMQENSRDIGTGWKPSRGTYYLFVEACLHLDSQNEKRRSLFTRGTCTQQALEYGRLLNYSVDCHLATMILNYCSIPEDVSSLTKLHHSVHTKGALELIDEDEAPYNQLNVYRDGKFPLMLEVLRYVDAIPMNPTLLTSLVKALFRSGCSGEGFAAMWKVRDTQIANIGDVQPFNALVQYSTNLDSYWPMQKSLEITAHCWHAPSNKSLYSVLHSIIRQSKKNDNAVLRSSVYRLLDPSYTPSGGYFLLDTISYFSGDDESDASELEGTQAPVSMSDNSGNSQSDISYDSGGEFFSSDQHIKQMLIWQLWQKYLMPVVNRRAVRQLIHCLHKVKSNDGLMLKYLTLILAEAEDKSDLASEMVHSLMHERVLRKDLVLNLIPELILRKIDLDGTALAQAALALDSKERIKKPFSVQNVLKLAIASEHFGSGFEESMVSAITKALIEEVPSSCFGQDGLVRKTTEEALIDLGILEIYDSLVKADTPQEQVLHRICKICLKMLREDSNKCNFIESLDQAATNLKEA